MVRRMRTALALGAAVLSLVAALASALAGEDDMIVFFLVLAGVAVVIAALTTGPWTRPARLVARTLAVAWVVAAIWIGALLVWYQSLCACSSPAPIGPPPNVAGIPTTLFHLLATYLGGAGRGGDVQWPPCSSWRRASLIPKWWAIS